LDKAEAFVKKYRSRGAYAVQGFAEDWRKIVDAPYHKRQRGNKKRAVPLVPVGDHQAKLSIYSKLKVKDEGHKDRIHFPFGDDWRNIDDKYFRELTCERLKRDRGRLRFERPKGRRNEALDTFKYGYAIFLLKDYRLKQREALLLERAARLEEKRERGESQEADESRREMLKKLLKEALKERLREGRR
jgi:phage terminase large subunit GpA-like protein